MKTMAKAKFLAAKKTKTHGEFFFEIGCEEIPAWMIPKALQELKVLLEKYLAAAGLLDGATVQVLGGPRRLAASIDAVLLHQQDTEKEITGPVKAVAFDAAGVATKAAQGFAAKQGVPVDQLYIRSTPRGEYVAAKQVTPGRAALEVLREVLPRVMQEISWPKNMRWTSGAGATHAAASLASGAAAAEKEATWAVGAAVPRFIRPVRWIVALLDGRVIPFTFADVRSGNKTNGHRFLGREGILVSGAGNYRSRLKSNFVLVDPAERLARITADLQKLMEKGGLCIHPDAGLLNLVTHLNEFPSALLGNFDPGFLDLPREILITVMRDHQKYFAVEKKGGSLAPHFVAIINLDRDRAGQIQHGHERVLRARFADARFFWDADLKCRLADNLEKLKQVVYESKLGTYFAKVERMRAISAWLVKHAAPSCSTSTVDRAAELAKCDLVSGMVREFPELQGIVGGLYARAQGELEEVADAVYDHYRPLSLDEEIPRNLTGCVVALADKLDALAGCFAVGRIPSGSSDPFALRRAATGIVKIVLERRLMLSLHGAIQAAFRALHEQNAAFKISPVLEKQLRDFILDRARFAFQQRLGFAYDEINATFAAGADDLLDAADRLVALRAIRRTPDFEPLAVAFKRIRNIIEKAGTAEIGKVEQFDPAMLTEDAEKALYAAAQEVARKAAEHKENRRYRQALENISSLRPAVDRFFDKVMVMAEDPAVRKNRLTLLAGLLKEFSTIADFSEIVTEKNN